MNPLDFLPLTLALPLLGVGLGLFAPWIRDRLFARLAVLLVGAAFGVAAVVIAPAFLAMTSAPTASAESESVPVHRQVLWRWIAAGDDMVGVSVAAHAIRAGETITSGAVTELVTRLDAENAAQLAAATWDRSHLVGLKAAADIAPLANFTAQNVPPLDAPFVSAEHAIRRAMIVDAELQLDGLSLLMLLVVTGIGFLIHLFSLGYMGHDPGLRRYFVYLNLFIFSMLVLVLGANFLVLFVGWELVGACSYLLIGFWFTDAANADAGRKAFIVNRVGDCAFLVGLMLVWTTFGTLSFAQVLPAAAAALPMGGWLAVAICACLVIGATGKSAQLPLFVWLPDAMAGPTPVSALIHAATMVTAGVYMVARAHLLFEQAPLVLAALAAIGAVTALMAALIALVQVDIKKVLAYSTISQLGYMFLGLGAGAYLAAIFHLMTHAFFKALLFLGAGSLMHGMERGFTASHEHPAPVDGVPAHQDMRHMGGLLRRLPVTGWTFVVGGLALAGVAPLAGFWSKDDILFGVLARSGMRPGLFLALWLVGLLTALLTAAYTGRQALLVLGGQARSAGAAAAVESPRSMTWPLMALAFLSIVGGFFGPTLAGFHPPLVMLLAPVLGEPEPQAAAKLGPALLALALAGVGLALAWLAYGPRPALDPERIASRWRAIYRLARAKFYLDDLYLALAVRPFRRAADWLWRVADDFLIDGTVNRVGGVAASFGQTLRRVQGGYARRYALSVLIGAVFIFAYLLLIR